MHNIDTSTALNSFFQVHYVCLSINFIYFSFFPLLSISSHYHGCKKRKRFHLQSTAQVKFFKVLRVGELEFYYKHFRFTCNLLSSYFNYPNSIFNFRFYWPTPNIKLLHFLDGNKIAFYSARSSISKCLNFRSIFESI